MDIILRADHETLAFAKDQLTRYLTRMMGGKAELLPAMIELDRRSLTGRCVPDRRESGNGPDPRQQ